MRVQIERIHSGGQVGDVASCQITLDTYSKCDDKIINLQP